MINKLKNKVKMNSNYRIVQIQLTIDIKKLCSWRIPKLLKIQKKMEFLYNNHLINCKKYKYKILIIWKIQIN